MIGPHDTQDRELVTLLQRGLPIVARPFDQVGQALGLDGDAVVARANALLEAGTARRFGAVFDLRHLGYRSALCAVHTTAADRDRLVPAIVAESGVTHCYLRGWPSDLDPGQAGGPGAADTAPNLWFTIADYADAFEDRVRHMQAMASPLALHTLPALQRFKIDVILGRQRRTGEAPLPDRHEAHGRPLHQEGAPTFSAQDRAIVQQLQDNLPRCARPFHAAAASLDMTPEALLDRLTEWKRTGVVRRIGVVLNHRKAGYRANGMCVWPVTSGRVPAAGRTLAAHPAVTHCYHRSRLDGFPYDLYAMIHGDAWETTLGMFEELAHTAGLEQGRILFSLHEYKKTSPVYFAEKTP